MEVKDEHSDSSFNTNYTSYGTIKMSDSVEKGNPPLGTKEIYTNTERFTKRKKTLILLTFGFILVCQSLAGGMSAPCLQQYSYFRFQQKSSAIVNFTASTTNVSSLPTCEKSINSGVNSGQTNVQRKTSQWNIYNSIIPRIISIVTAPIFGVLSDKVGRKPFIIFPIFGNLIRQVLYTLGIYFDLNIYIFVAFGITDAIFGRASMSCMYVSMIDFTPADNTRSITMGMMTLAAGIGASISFVSAGYLIKSFGFMFTMLVSAAILVPSACAAFFIPETLSDEIKNASKEKTKCKVYTEHFKSIYQFYTKEHAVQGKRTKYIVCILIFSFTQIANTAIQGFETLFVLNAPLCWDSVKIGWYGLEKSLTLQITSMGIFKLMQKGLSDPKISIISSVSSTFTYMYEAFVFNDIMMFTVPVLGSLCYLPVPIIQATMSNMTPLDKQGILFAGQAVMEMFVFSSVLGVLFAGQAVIEMICELLGSVIGNGIYGATVDIYTGIAFFFLSGLTAIAATLTLFLIFKKEGDTIQGQRNMGIK